MNNETMILTSSDEAAKFVTDIKGWVSRDGRFYGDDERLARWAGATHIICECGKPARKSYTCCDECQSKRATERWLALPIVVWDEVTPLCIYQDDTYFFGLDEVIDHCEANDLDIENLQLVVCEPSHLRQIDEDYWEDELPEDGELPTPIQLALDALNKAIEEHGDEISWHGGKQRVQLSMPPVTDRGDQ